ncbi:FAD-dependent oxidoreductase-like enzyme [Colletotrichum truncatum]|uniref:FAD-dependent oxidoreductase-like enzyme n=1 Tax=Colletotrichum truncatum TaxID=5467 RepID=A0ACC3YPB3_COLTU|nr:FAD-dependent oxidoreductase-like enzyme [Colletotrichum truncatum]KAF6784210.1 FAD-dependent oxidoreductase-like enzyme [Colletotrichum truncatum]
MAADSDAAAQQPNGTPTDNRSVVDEPTTPQENDVLALNSSQVTLPSTEVPASPIDPNQSFKTEVNDDRMSSAAVIPSSLTPPPSSQVVAHTGHGALQATYGGSQRSALFSPPATVLNTTVRRDGGLGSEYLPPAPQQVLEATADELRAMMQTCIDEHAKLKMEAAHHKLQYNLLSLQADEDAKRAAVEHEMTRREIEALRTAEFSRQAVRELSAASESAQIKYLQMKMSYEEAMEENEALARRVKMAKKVISQKEEEIVTLAEERDMLLNRIRENREHFHMLCSPGGIFHGAMTPKQQSHHHPTVSTPQQAHRATPKQTPRSANRDARVDRDHGPEPIAALLQALSQDNNSAPTTPTKLVRPAPRMPPKHTRNTQSLSSLPTTPLSRPHRHEQSGLLPSVNLVPQSEPRHRYSSSIHVVPGTPPPPPPPVREPTHKSRESTISADDNEELARQALESVAKSASFLSQASRTSSRGSRRPLPGGGGEGEEEEVYESQASQAASEMLRRDPRESFEVASSVGSRDVTPAPAEKSARLHAKLFPGIAKGHATPDKRKFSGGASNAQEALSNIASQSKRMRMNGPVEENPKVGLGIQYGYS